MRFGSQAAVVAFGLCACSGSGAPAAQPAAESQPAAVAPSAAPAPAANPQPAPAVATPADPDEACAQIIAVAYKGAKVGAETATRDKAAAEQRARELLAKLPAADFGALAKTESDAPKSAARGGVIGTFRREQWPELHAQLEQPVFALTEGEIAKQPVLTDYGYAIVRRCPVEKASSRHILVRYKGAKNAGPEIKRSKAEAAARARELLAQLAAGADFDALARSASEDKSKERGGELGAQGRGVLALPFEQALFALKPGQRSDVVETEFGFHIIERQ